MMATVLFTCSMTGVKNLFVIVMRKAALLQGCEEFTGRPGVSSTVASKSGTRGCEVTQKHILLVLDNCSTHSPNVDTNIIFTPLPHRATASHGIKKISLLDAINLISQH